MVKYRHLFNKYNPFGGLTLVYTSSDVYGSGDILISYSYSLCSEKDHYSRKIGIDIASKKFFLKKAIWRDGETTDVEAILIDILKSYQLPEHAVWATLRELDTIAYIKYEKTCDRNRKLVLKNKKGEFDE